jgi:hypothetical protein
LSRWKFRKRAIFGCKAAFTIDAVKTADFTIYRQQVDSQGLTQTAAPYWPEDYTVEQKSGHSLKVIHSEAKIE